MASGQGMGRTLNASVHTRTRVTALDVHGRRVLALGADPVQLHLEGDAADRVSLRDGATSKEKPRRLSGGVQIARSCAGGVNQTNTPASETARMPEP